MKRKKDGAQGAPGLKSLWEPAAYLLPFLIGLAVFVVYPFINVFLISFQNDYNMMTGAFDGFGVENYRKILADPNFLNGLRNTALYVVFVVPVSTAISLGIASMLNANIRLKGLFQTCYFLPMVTSITAVGLVWKWLNDPKYNLAALILYGIWNMLPFTTILLLSGYQNIDRQYYTAARVDGAKQARIFLRITVPLLAPTIGLTLIVNTITASKVFTELFPLFNGNPGSAYSLYTVVYYLYDMFYTKWELGPAAASAVVLFAIVLVLTVLQLFVQRKWKNY